MSKEPKWLRIVAKVLMRLVSVIMIVVGIHLVETGEYFLGFIAFGVPLMVSIISDMY